LDDEVMPWRTVTKDGAINIFGSLFYLRGGLENRRSFPVGAKVWVEEGFETNEIQVWKTRHRDFMGFGSCPNVWDEKVGIYRAETRQETRLRQRREELKSAMKDVQEAMEEVERELDAEALPETEPFMAPEMGVPVPKPPNPVVGRVVVIATFVVMNGDRDGVPPLRTELYTFGYPVHERGETHQQIADALIDDITESWNSPAISHVPQDQLGAFRTLGEGWSWHDAVGEDTTPGEGTTAPTEHQVEASEGAA
jgi:hypothetical protein